MKNFLSVLALSTALTATAQSHEFVIKAGSPGAVIQPTMYGIFFEDINFAADGGLYAELIQNRSFEFPNPYAAWDISGNVTLRKDGPFERNPHYVRLAPTGHGAKATMIENHGFFGIGVKAGADYRFSVWARCPEGGEAHLRVDLTDNATMGEDQNVCQTPLIINNKEWQKYTVTFRSPVTLPKAHLRVWGDAGCTVDLEHVSLFPADTYRGEEGGLRRDLAEALEQMHPGVFRFPGGCIVEGGDLASRYQWKNSVGPVENRPLNENRWHYSFQHRYYPNYNQSYGLGFYEFFRLAEQIGAEPLPVLSCGLACQYQNDIKDEATAHAAVEDLGPYIQDCIDLIEFANGDPTESEWARLRAEMGHPAPFDLKFLAIGNEQWDYEDNPAFTRRLKPFIEAIRKVHPEIQLIGSTGPDSEGWKFDDLQQKMKALKCDLYDEHYYRNEAWFLDARNRHRYDSYDRSKGTPKVFAGEYACHGDGKKWNHFNAALMEAQFMTGLERNADLVQMATYAPLFAHVEGWQWRPDAIWYDNLESFKTCSYYVQQMYATHKGDRVLPLTMHGKAVAGDEDQHGLSACASLDSANSNIYVKVANVSDAPQPVTLNIQGVKRSFTSVTTLTLHADEPTAENTIAAPTQVVPVAADFPVSGNKIEVTIPAKSFVVYTLK